MIECEKCGANLSLKDASCPYCNEPNPDAIEHIRMLAYYKNKFETEKEELVTETRTHAPLRTKRMLLAILLILFVLVTFLNVGSDSIRGFFVNRKYEKNITAAQELTYERMRNVEPSLIYNDYMMRHKANSMELYCIKWVNESYVFSLQFIMKTESCSKDQVDEINDNWKRASYWIHSFYEKCDNIENGKLDAGASYSDREEELFIAYADDLRTRMNILVEYYGNIPTEEIDRFMNASEAEQFIMLQEYYWKEDKGE